MVVEASTAGAGLAAVMIDGHLRRRFGGWSWIIQRWRWRGSSPFGANSTFPGESKSTRWLFGDD